MFYFFKYKNYDKCGLLMTSIPAEIKLPAFFEVPSLKSLLKRPELLKNQCVKWQLNNLKKYTFDKYKNI